MKIVERIRSFKYAGRGITIVFKEEDNFKIHALAMVSAILLGYFLEINTNEWLWIALAITTVIISEMFNSAIESIVDLVSPDFHRLAGKAKDISAGAVLVGATFAVVVALVIFLPYLINL